MSDQKDVEIDYTNWRGERRWRPIRPISLNFESNEWHQNSQWLLEAIDLQDGQTKTFSMATVHGWSELAPACRARHAHAQGCVAAQEARLRHDRK
jgi:predicted DNA-binding transcriptional regulator YafY